MFAQCLQINVNIGVFREALKFPCVKRDKEYKKDLSKLCLPLLPSVNTNILSPVLDEKGGKGSVVRYE